METRFCEGQSSKGNNSKNINVRVTVLALCTSSNMIEICMKFREDSSSYRADTIRDRQTDGRTDGRPGKTICLPTLRGET